MTAADSIQPQPRPRLPRGDRLYETPPIAWPTMGVFIGALNLWGLVTWGAITQGWSLWWVVPVNAFCIYGLFTVLHDGVHRSVARGYPRLNELVATIAGLCLTPVGTAAVFRYAHLKHHRTTNEPGVDPDMWSGIGSRWSLPLQWATADLGYAVHIYKHRDEIDRKVVAGAVLSSMVILGAYTASWWVGVGVEATLYWLLPSRLAIFWLAFAFNFLPHHPHTALQSHNPYAATNVRLGGEPLATGLMFYQNYHLVHHLFPGLPFYRYVRIWRRNASDWAARGAPVTRWTALEAKDAPR